MLQACSVLNFLVQFSYPDAFISPGNWTPFLAYETFRNGTIDLKISLPPAEYNLTHFDIYLNNQSDGKTVQQSGNFVTQVCVFGSIFTINDDFFFILKMTFFLVLILRMIVSVSHFKNDCISYHYLENECLLTCSYNENDCFCFS